MGHIRKNRVPKNEIDLFVAMHTNVWGNIGKERFFMGRGVRQGCILGPVLFNVIFNYVVESAKLSGGVKIRANGKDVVHVHGEYADDLYLVDHSVESLNKNLAKLDVEMKRSGIVISVAKTKALWLSGYGDEPVRIGQSAVETVREFKYLVRSSMVLV